MKGIAVLLKLLVIAAVLVFGFFGVQDAFKFSGSHDSSNSANNFNIPFTNETIKPPTNTSFDFKSWLYNFPTKDIIDVIVGGIGGFVNWVSQGVYAGISWVVHLIFPSVSLPQWIGSLVVVLILIIILYASWNNLWSSGHSLGMWGVVVLVVILIVAAVLSMLGLVR